LAAAKRQARRRAPACQQLLHERRDVGRRLGIEIQKTTVEVGMLDRAEFRPSQLSGGQRQRINIARAIVHSPAALLVDEPTSALDAARSREIIALLRDLTREHSLATVVVTHDVEHLPEFDRVHEMRDGVLTRVR